MFHDPANPSLFMITKPLASVLLLSTTVFGLAAGEADSARETARFAPKNLARQHVGSNLFLFNATSQSYQPTEAAAAWLDDDVSTGWPIMAGRQHYLLTLAEPTLLTNIALSTRAVPGTVTIYAGDEPAAPGAKAWSVLAKDIPLEAINGKKLAKSFSRFAKYLLIETDIADPGPLFSLYIYGNRPEASYQLRQRETPIDTRAIFGPYVNNPTAYSVAALYAHGVVTYANSPEGSATWQNLIDENPETSLVITPTSNEAGLVVKLALPHALSRFAVLTSAPVAGKLDFFVAPGTVTDSAVTGEPTATSLEGLTPDVTIVLDGTGSRRSIDFPQVEGGAFLVRWTPDTAGEAIGLCELNAFNEFSLSDYELSWKPEAVTELTPAESAASHKYASAGEGRDGKDFKDYKGPACCR